MPANAGIQANVAEIGAAGVDFCLRGSDESGQRTGNLVLELVKADPAPDAAVMDLNPRGELSWPAIEVLARRGVPVVITSGYVGLDPAREAAAAEVIAKPVSSERLVKAVARAVSQKNGARSG